MQFTQLLNIRQSIRKYNGQPIEDAVLNQILDAGLRAPSGRGVRGYEMIVVKDKAMLEKLSHCRQGAALMLQNAAAAIILLGNPEVSDTWIENSSLALGQMHLKAAELSVGSCWIQGRGRVDEAENSTDSYVRSLLGYPEPLCLEAILSLGMVDTIEESTKNYPEGLVHFEQY